MVDEECRCRPKRYNKGEIVYIPDKPQVPPHLQPTVNAYASVIEPKHANILVRKLNQIAPLGNLYHVKRVRKKCLDGGKTQLSVILCLAGDCLDDMPNDVLELVDSYQLSIFIAKACKYAALLKEEWKEQCKLWPTSFHPPTYNIDGITGFSEEDSQSVFTFMELDVDLAKSGGGQVVNAAVIVDPSSKQVIASACDQTHTSKTNAEGSCLKYPETTTSDSTANGFKSHEISKLSGELRQLSSAVSCLHPWMWAEQQSCGGYFLHPL